MVPFFCGTMAGGDEVRVPSSQAARAEESSSNADQRVRVGMGMRVGIRSIRRGMVPVGPAVRLWDRQYCIRATGIAPPESEPGNDDTPSIWATTRQLR